MGKNRDTLSTEHQSLQQPRNQTKPFSYLLLRTMGTRQLPRSALSCAVLALFCALALTSAYAQGVPSGWECDEDQYNDGSFCDCHCGVYDPDCDIYIIDEDWCLESETCQNVNGFGYCVPI